MKNEAVLSAMLELSSISYPTLESFSCAGDIDDGINTKDGRSRSQSVDLKSENSMSDFMAPRTEFMMEGLSSWHDDSGFVTSSPRRHSIGAYPKTKVSPFQLNVVEDCSEIEQPRPSSRSVAEDRADYLRVIMEALKTPKKPSMVARAKAATASLVLVRKDDDTYRGAAPLNAKHGTSASTALYCLPPATSVTNHLVSSASASSPLQKENPLVNVKWNTIASSNKDLQHIGHRGAPELFVSRTISSMLSKYDDNAPEDSGKDDFEDSRHASTFELVEHDGTSQTRPTSTEHFLTIAGSFTGRSPYMTPAHAQISASSRSRNGNSSSFFGDITLAQIDTLSRTHSPKFSQSSPRLAPRRIFPSDNLLLLPRVLTPGSPSETQYVEHSPLVPNDVLLMDTVPVPSAVGAGSSDMRRGTLHPRPDSRDVYRSVDSANVAHAAQCFSPSSQSASVIISEHSDLRRVEIRTIHPVCPRPQTVWQHPCDFIDADLSSLQDRAFVLDAQAWRHEPWSEPDGSSFKHESKKSKAFLAVVVDMVLTPFRKVWSAANPNAKGVLRL